MQFRQKHHNYLNEPLFKLLLLQESYHFIRRYQAKNIVDCASVFTCSQNRQSTKFQNHENINFVEKLYFFILYNQVYIAKHDVKSLHSGFIFRENASHYKVGG